MRRWLTGAAILPIGGYQLFVGPLPGPRCRFHPSRSRTAIEVVETHGALEGLWPALRHRYGFIMKNAYATS